MIYIKKPLITSTFLLAFLILSAGVAYAEEPGCINAENVNFRSAPSTSSKVHNNFSKNTKVTVISKEGDWFKIIFNNITGWVYGKYVTVQKSNSVSAASAKESASQLTDSVKGPVALDSGKITGNNVNVRKGPGEKYEVITKLNKGASVYIYEVSGNWAKINLDKNSYGWVCKDYLSIGKGNTSRGGERTSGNSGDNSNLRKNIVEYAKSLLGVKYVYGGTTTKGFDCSGFVQHVYKKNGITIDRTSVSQASGGKKIDKSDLLPGDLVFFDTNGGKNRVNHSGIYIGNGKFIHASSGKSTRCVTISSLSDAFYAKSYMTARRYID